MKRIFISLLTVIACSMAAMAQDSRVATLQHGTNFRTYYGADAFVSAHNDASNGDVITLSAGEFNVDVISKAVTVRGEGMDVTVLNSYSINCTIPNDESYSLCLEGLTLKAYSQVKFSSDGGSATVIMSKCSITGNAPGVAFEKCNSVSLNSKFESYVISSSNSSVIVKNSIFLRGINKSSDLILSGTSFDIQNCFIVNSNLKEMVNSSIKNSIIGVRDGVEYSIDESVTSSHCLVREGGSGFDNSWYVTGTAPTPDPWGETPVVTLWDDLFTEEPYHLTEEAAQTYVGTDGTEVGIYGGDYPYNEIPDYPLVKSIDVKGIHENGKLSVDIKVE